MGEVDRRRFLKRVGAAGAMGGAAVLGGRGYLQAAAPHKRSGAHAAHRALAQGAVAQGTGQHNVIQSHNLDAVGRVDNERNGFNPTDILTDFDGGATSKDRSGRTVREYEFQVLVKDVEVTPGVFFPAWTYNGRIPGPTIKATEGDRVRVTLNNTSDHPHTIHFHGIHQAQMDGVPGAGETLSGESFTYDFIAEPFGTHLYHCHSFPLVQHIARGLYGAFIIEPKQGRPDAHEMVMVMNAFDTNFDEENEVYALNTVAFHYVHEPIKINIGELQRAHVINVTEFDFTNSLHLHANFFHLYRTGTSLQPNEFTDIIHMGQAERHMLEFTYKYPGTFVFHAHQTEFIDLGWLSAFEVS